MPPSKRGYIHSDTRARQLVKFEGLHYGKITPTDADGILDFNNKLWIFFELKTKGTPMPRGQELCLQRLAERVQAGGCVAFVIEAEHETPPTRDIIAEDALVTRYYAYAGERWQWIKPKQKTTLKEAIAKTRKAYGFKD